MTQKNSRPQADSIQQGEAVEAALDGDQNEVDRWEEFSKADVDKLAKDKPTPAGAQIPLAGLPHKD